MDDTTMLQQGGLSGPVPQGANLPDDGSGATFKTWAPAAREVRLRWDYTRNPAGEWSHQHEAPLQQLDGGHWGGFVPGLKAGERYCRWWSSRLCSARDMKRI